ncbi:MAG: hypothetical protein GY953_08345, partial [bacterium]|nr:hypothetical protein [bacterium]
MDSPTWQLTNALLPAFLLGAALGALVLWLWGRGRMTVLRERLELSGRQQTESQELLAENERLRI